MALVPSSQTSYVDYASNAPVSANLYYQVTALDPLHNQSDLSPSSSYVYNSPAMAVPLAPVPLPISGGPNTFFYHWLLNPQTDAVTVYYVYGFDYLTPVAIAPTPLATYVEPTSTTTPVFKSPATPWSINSYYVVAQNATGASTPTNFSVLGASSVSLSVGVPVPTQAVTVSWNFVVSNTPTVTPDSYNVYRSVTQGAQFTPLAIVPYPTMIYMDSTASAGQSFYYRVTARSNGIESSLYPYPNVTPGPEVGVLTWPSAPVSLAANGAVSQTTLSWASNPVTQGVQSYLIYQNGILIQPTTTITPTLTPATPPTPNSFSFPDMPGAESVYQVVAQNAQGYSNAASVSVLLSYSSGPTISLTPPFGISPTPNSTPAYPVGVWISNFYPLTPSPTPGAISAYAVYRSIDPTPTASCTACWNYVGLVTTATPVYLDSGAVSGFANYYQIFPQNQDGTVQGNSNPQTALPVTFWPAAPVSLTAQTSASGLAITLAWSPYGNATVTGFDIYRTTSAFSLMTFLATPTGTTYTDTSVTNGYPYFYWVDANGQGVSSAPTSVGALAVPAPANFSVTTGPAVNSLAWNPVAVPTGSPVSGYSVQSLVFPSTPIPNTTPTPGFAPIGPAIIEGLNNTTYADTTVTDDNKYMYQVAAAAPNPWGIGSLLGGFALSATVLVYPQPVTNLQAVSGDGSVQLRWNYQGTQKFTYNIQRKLGSAPVTAYQTVKSGLQGINYIDAGLLDKTLYDYQIYTVDAFGLTSAAAMVQALPAEAPYVGNPLVSLSQIQQNNLTGNLLNWSPANIPTTSFDPTKMYPLGGYYVFRSNDGGGTYELVGTVTSSEGATQSPVTFFDQVPLVGGAANTYLIWAFDVPAGVNTSDVNMVHETPYTPITAFPLSAGAALDRNAIRPNGGSNERKVGVRFAVTSAGKVEIKVYSLSGTYIKTLFSNDNVPIGVWGTYLANGQPIDTPPYSCSWDARNMAGNLVASGVYLITVEMNGHQEIDKVAVIK